MIRPSPYNPGPGTRCRSTDVISTSRFPTTRLHATPGQDPGALYRAAAGPCPRPSGSGSRNVRAHDRFRPVETDAGVGLSTEAEAVAAARAAARGALERSGAARADWGLVFITAAHRPRFAEMLAAI